MNKYKFFLKDSAWSIAALVLMNSIVQLVLYPFLRNKLGADEYGNVLYLIGIVNIIGTSVGCSANNSRLKNSVSKIPLGKTYHLFLLLCSVIFLPLSLGILYFSGEKTTFSNILLYWLLISATTYRNYADVEYRLTTNYRHYFFYYLSITIGYIAGIPFFLLTGDWKLMFLMGEICSILTIVLRKKTNDQLEEPINKANISRVFYSVVLLLLAQLMVNVVLNADRLVLKLFVSNTAVTIYYVASLIGKTVALITGPLNSVIIGHLAKKEKNMNRPEFLKVSLFILLISFFVLGICVLGSHIFVSLFYPNEYESAKSFFLLANAAQIFYFVTGIINIILLRYIKEVYQIIINGVYCLLFAIITIPATIYFGIWGFSYSICFVNILRFILAVAIGFCKLKNHHTEDYHE